MANNIKESPPKKETSRSQRIGVKFTGVSEGHQFDFNSDEIRFAFCDNLCSLYADQDGEDVAFKDFTQGSQIPKSGFCVFDPRLVENLSKIGVTSMRPSQIATLMVTYFNPPPTRLANLPDFVCISSTGSGKTIAYLAPMIQKCLDRIKGNPSKSRKPMVLIFGHSIPLVTNIFQTALKLTIGTGIKVKLISGSTRYLRDSNFDIGICSIGRFRNHLDLSEEEGNKGIKIDMIDVQYLVVDECDQMASSKDFLQILEKLKDECPKKFSTLMYSATFAPSVFSLFDETNYFGFCGGKINKVPPSVRTLFWQIDTRSWSRITGAAQGKVINGVYGKHELRNPFDAFVHFVQYKLFDAPNNTKKVIVFVKRNIVADLMAHRLFCYGIPAVPVHGKRGKNENEKFLQEFIDGKCRILIATNLLTRGTDIDNVEYVINYDVPLEYNNWVHRCGRTGRNGNRGAAITFVDIKNTDDYPHATLKQIAANVQGKMPEFMKAYMSNGDAETEEAAAKNFNDMVQ